MPRQWTAVASYVDAAMLRRSLLVAAIVGTTLMSVNEGPLFMFGPAVDYFKMVLTFCVPFIVSLISGMAARIAFGGSRRLEATISWDPISCGAML
jgi:hypothetical protein